MQSLIVLKPGRPRLRFGQVWFLPVPLFLTHCLLHSLCVFTWPLPYAQACSVFLPHLKGHQCKIRTPFLSPCLIIFTYHKALYPHSRESNGTPLQYSCLGNPMYGGAWWAVVHGVAKSQIRLSDFTFAFHFHALEKEMATHSSVLAWRIPGTGEPGGLPSMGSHRVGYDWSDLAAAAAYPHRVI